MDEEYPLLRRFLLGAIVAGVRRLWARWRAYRVDRRTQAAERELRAYADHDEPPAVSLTPEQRGDDAHGDAGRSGEVP